MISATKIKKVTFFELGFILREDFKVLEPEFILGIFLNQDVSF